VRPRLLRPSEFVKLQLGPGESAPADLLRRLDMIGGSDGRARARGIKGFEGLIPIEVARYRGLMTGRLEPGALSWSLGRRVTVAPGRVSGRVESISPPGAPAAATGWALDPKTGQPADWLLLFSGNRLVAASAGGVRRAGVARARDAATPLIGFALKASGGKAAASRPRVFAVVDGAASELIPR
jgi:hypothetical protein